MAETPRELSPLLSFIRGTRYPDDSRKEIDVVIPPVFIMTDSSTCSVLLPDQSISSGYAVYRRKPEQDRFVSLPPQSKVSQKLIPRHLDRFAIITGGGDRYRT